jgi:hypothetical protein
MNIRTAKKTLDPTDFQLEQNEKTHDLHGYPWAENMSKDGIYMHE